MSRRLSLLLALTLVFSALVAPVPAHAGGGPVVVTELNLRAIDWGTSMYGWTVGDDGGVLMTTNGGIDWHVQWVPTSADLTDVCFLNATTGYITTATGAVLRTTDGGLTWTTKQLTTKPLHAVDFTDSTHGWVVGDDMTGYRTTDGANWTKMTLAAASTALTDVRGVSFVNASTGWICGGDGVGDGFDYLYIAKTTNGGASWTRTSNGPHMGGGSDDIWTYDDIDFADSTHGWVTGFLSSMHVTSNGGTTWSQQMAGGNSVAAYNTMRVASASFTGSGSSSVGIQVTTDGGLNWTSRSQPVSIPAMGYSGYPDVAWQDGNNLWVAGPGFLVRHNIPDNSWFSYNSYNGHVNFLGGHDRYATSVELSKRSFYSATTVVLATGLAFPDGLSASGLCGAYTAPLLLTGPTLPASVKAEITRLGATKVVIVGGTGAVPAAVATEVDAMPGVTVERLAGTDRYDTSRVVAERIHTLAGDRARAFVVRGDAFADALAAGPAAYANVYPILLVEPTRIPRATQIAIDGGGYGAFTVVGGTSAVSNDIMSSILDATGKTVNRVYGADRYSTATAVATYSTGTLGMASPIAGLATGLNFPDALSAGPALGREDSVLLLTDPKALSAATASWTGARDLNGGWVIGDRQGAITDKTANAFSRLVP